MTKRSIQSPIEWTLVIAVTLGWALTGCAPPSGQGNGSEPVPLPALRPLEGAAEGFNVWLISIDTLRADRLGAWGYEDRNNSPRIDDLVQLGAVFERVGAPRAATWPSLASVLTGLYPSGHGLIANGYSFSDGQITLASLLADAGYETAAFLSNMCQANHQDWGTRICAGGADGRIHREVLSWLDQRVSSRPALLWTHYFGSHGPYYNGGDLAETTLDPGYQGPVAADKRVLNRIMTDGIPLDEADVAHLDAIYDAAVMGTDAMVGRLLDAVAERIDLEHTIIVLLADHGEDLYDHHRYLYHACSVYQSSLHVPLAIIAPGLIREGSRLSAPASLVDVLPTLLELLAVPAPPELHGTSLLPRLGDPRRPSGTSGGEIPVFSEYGDEEIATIWQDRWKLIHNPGEVQPICLPGASKDLYPISRVELYDLEQDPDESRNLAEGEPERVQTLLEKLLAWRATLGGGAERQELDQQLREELEALGYVVE